MATRAQIGFAAGGAVLAVVAGYSYFPVALTAAGPVLGVVWMAAVGSVSGLFMKAMFVKS